MAFKINSVLICLLFLVAVVDLRNARNNNTNLERSKRQSDNHGITCELPPYPRNGKWTVVNGEQKPGDRVEKNSIVRFECNPDHKLTSCCPFLICDENWDLSKVPLCEKKCPPKYSSPTTFIKCEDKFGADVSCDEAVDGTYLSYTCAPFYETPFGYKKTILCVEGTWNFPNPVCQPVCGKKIDKDTIPLIYVGEKKDRREYPWIVAVYKKIGNEFNNVCGASLVSQKIVITAAHCVTNEYGNALPAQNFMLGAGTYYSKYRDSREISAQYKEVSRIIVQPGYKGASQRFLADLALIVTKDFIVVNEVVQPVCYQGLPNIYLQAGKIGVVAGWGTTETGEQPDELRTLEIPFKHQSTCSQELPSDWADRFNTYDKICAGFFNQNKSVCTGDSGSGLFFQNPEDNRYYVHGVVSVAPGLNGACNPQQNSLYTSVAHYYDFVDKKITKQYVEQCYLPPHPKNGKWTIGNQDKKPGDIVSSNTALNVKCDAGYVLSSNSAFLTCETAFAMPHCEPSCPTLSFPKGTISSCTNSKGETIECSRAVHGTSITYSCPEGYRVSPGAQRVAFCNANSWGRVKPGCEKDDAVKPETVKPETVTPETTIPDVSGTTEKKVVCSYASWYAYNKVLPEDLNATLCTHIVYSFVRLLGNGEVKALNEPIELKTSQKGLFTRFTDLKGKNGNLKILLSVGTTSGADADRFSDMSKNPAKKSAFIRTFSDLIQSYNFDGANVEWFFPQPHDKLNYVNLLKDLREKCNEKGWLLTATIRSYPEESGYDGKEMSKLLDFVIVRTYDFYGPWSPYIGQNSPLYSSSVENDWERNHLNIDASAKNWIAGGIPKSKMVLSIAFFGRSFKLQDKSSRGVHAKFTGAGQGDGFLRYSEFCFLKGWTMVWDDEQKSAISYHEDEWVGHENDVSVRTKAAYVKNNGFLGVNVWPIDGDDVYGRCGPKQFLLKQVHVGLA